MRRSNILPGTRGEEIDIGSARQTHAKKKENKTHLERSRQEGVADVLHVLLEGCGRTQVRMPFINL